MSSKRRDRDFLDDFLEAIKRLIAYAEQVSYELLALGSILTGEGFAP
jgi:uncharacterized protein with HEPN domain